VPYLSASAVVIHEEALYQVYVPLPLLEADVLTVARWMDVFKVVEESFESGIS